jgi:hypothetical protein
MGREKLLADQTGFKPDPSAIFPTCVLPLMRTRCFYFQVFWVII